MFSRNEGALSSNLNTRIHQKGFGLPWTNTKNSAPSPTLCEAAHALPGSSSLLLRSPCAHDSLQFLRSWLILQGLHLGDRTSLHSWLTYCLFGKRSPKNNPEVKQFQRRILPCGQPTWPWGLLWIKSGQDALWPKCGHFFPYYALLTNI